MQKKIKFSAYPTRGITLSDEVWKSLKEKKIKYGKNWNTFIREILKNDNK